MTSTSTTIRTIFVDTSAWIALAVSRDELHGPAIQFYDRLPPTARLVTTNLILAETHAFILRRKGSADALRFCAGIRNSTRLDWHQVSEAEEEEAWNLLKKRMNWRLSFTDASSFIVLKKFPRCPVFTFDRHFSAGGFVIVPWKGAL